MSMFKSYDIRGLCPEQPDELTPDLARQIGLAAGRLLPGKTVVVGRYMPPTGPALSQALIQGLTRAGKDVVDIGQVTTPMVTFAVAKFGHDGGVMVTASHNPQEYNGFKLSGKGAEPISYETGINQIEQWVRQGDLPEADQPGSVTSGDILPDYLDHLQGAAAGIRDVRIVIDAGNGMGGVVMTPLFEHLDAELVPLYFEPDGTFPHHEANPLEPENLVDLQRKVVEEGADLGAALDGDADRVIFVDETGQPVPPDLLLALIAREVLARKPGATILHDLRSSWAVAEDVREHGGTPIETRVGHSLIKAGMRQHGAAFGGELSGHYYFEENFSCDSGAFTLLKVLSLLCRERRPLSELVAPLRRYHHSGEINSVVEDKAAKLDEIRQAHADGQVSELDGVKVTYEDWWFNVRPSNTEEKLRLVVEAKTCELMEDKCRELLKLIRGPYVIRRILFPTDFSDYAEQALPYALGIAREHDAELHLLHVVPTPDWTVQFEQVAPVLDATFFDEIERSARERLQGVVAPEAAKGLRFVTRVRRGPAFLEIVRYAKERRVDLITIATHGRSGLRHALFGSVAEKVVRKAPCPVLSIRPEGHGFAMP